MGKKLIIKGADFSVNGIDGGGEPVYVQTSLYQGYFMNDSSPAARPPYGTTVESDNFVRARTPIIIPVGKRVQVYVADGNSIVQGLKVGVVWSTSSFDISGDGVTIPNLVGNVYPSTTDLRQSDGSFIITNNCSVAAYLYTTHGYYPTAAALSAATHQYYYKVLDD